MMRLSRTVVCSGLEGTPVSSARPKVSICITTYNQVRFIGQAIDSALAQRVSFIYEIVIGEDCSDDGTREIIIDYQQRHPDKIRALLRPKNLGPQKNFWHTLEECRGLYVALLEGDDYWTDVDKIQIQADMLDNAPSAFVCGARAQVWRDGDPEPYLITPAESSEVLSTYGARELFEGKWWFRTCTTMLPRSVLRSAPYRFCRDWSGGLWAIARTNFGKVCFLDRIVAVYREHAGGIFSSQSRAQKAMTDAETLFKVIPLFTGQDRRYLENLLREKVATLLEADGMSRLDSLRCAALAALRSPGAFQSWRDLLVSVRRAVAPRYPNTR